MSVPNDWPSLERNKDRQPPYGWIQWKGTDVCMDVHCICGNPLHVDADFCYHIRCAYCGQVYECSGYIDLIPLNHCPENTITVVS
ncbi:MAG: hypothetical protein ACTHMU_04095 [Thermomicrobiales bacterium]